MLTTRRRLLEKCGKLMILEKEDDEIVLVMNYKIVTSFEKVRHHMCSHVAKPHKPHPLLPHTHYCIIKWKRLASLEVMD
jgi:hypothetical protein